MIKPERNNQKSGNNKSKAKIEHSAGGVVFRRTGRGILIGLILDPYRKWTFPKGHVEKGETIEEAALRETREEMGLRRLRIVCPLGKTSIWFRDRFDRPGTLIHKYISYFLMETSASETGRPQKSEHVLAVRWVPFRRALAAGSYKNMVSIVKNAVACLQKEFVSSK